MRTRQGLEPNLGLSEALYPAKGMLDMGAATARGITRGTLGLPGDLESLMRMIVGGNQTLPTSEDFDKKLTKGTYLSAPNTKQRSPFDDLGVFYNVPIYGGAISAAGKGIKKLGGKIVGGETSLGRREFAKKAGAIGLGSTALMKAVKYLDELEKTTPITKEVDNVLRGWDKVDGDGYVHAIKNVPKYKYNSLKEYNDELTSKSKEYYSKIKDDPNWYQHEDDYIKFWRKQQAILDEQNYNQEKFLHKEFGKDPVSGEPLGDDILNMFSPQAKAEMRAFKEQADEWSYSKAKSQADAMEGFGWNTSKEYDNFIDNIRDNSHWTEFLDDYVKNSK